jgi:hypothetical protein
LEKLALRGFQRQFLIDLNRVGTMAKACFVVKPGIHFTRFNILDLQEYEPLCRVAIPEWSGFNRTNPKLSSSR